MTRRIQDFQGYYEDFEVGAVYQHDRGKTVSELDNVLITNMVINTAEPHFNEHVAQGDAMFGMRTVFGGINISMVIGLAAQDTAQRCIREIGMDKIRLHTRVYHGDTLYAYTEILAKEPADGGGVITFAHQGYNQDDVLVYSGERRALIASRPAR